MKEEQKSVFRPSVIVKTSPPVKRGEMSCNSVSAKGGFDTHYKKSQDKSLKLGMGIVGVAKIFWF